MKQKYRFYTTNELKPKGWLKRQLEIQAAGLSGNLDKVWRDVKDSAWIGGDAEGWERVPYWLDGFIPLAYLLEDEDMIARAKKYIDAIISFQKPDGWICPCSDDARETYDTWAVQLITKVLVVYYECSKDERIPDVLYRTLKNYYDLLSTGKINLHDWGKYRWFECFIGLNFLYERYPEDWIKELAKLLRAQGIDYNTLTPQWETPQNHWDMATHIVNICMSLKYEAVSNPLLDEPYCNHARELYDILKKYNGTPVEIFTGDECLSGLSPIQGTELCSVTELMYSYEILYACTGDQTWAERLEVVAFNALPATLSDDMWAHQYDQMSNQIACQRFDGDPIFRTNGPDAHLFGLEPNYGCCTANFNQGWPKFALAAFMHQDDTIINAFPIPSELKTKEAQILLETNYPFESNFRYTISADRDFIFKIRIPSFAENVLLNGERIASEDISIPIKSGEQRELLVSYTTACHFEQRPNELYTVKYGSLVFSVPISYEKKMHEYEKDGVERKFPYCDYEYLPISDWNYAYTSDEFLI
ncbi:MAG: glycoside hydrolase family 127 protein, partial [Lachnospiraceae bacterium]|nr:glycoside hydrolase family 127 protein [Lachnospiraceae bacterium]